MQNVRGACSLGVRTVILLVDFAKRLRLFFVTPCTSLLVAKKHEGSLTAREAALLIVSEELGCVLPSSNIVQRMNDDHFFLLCTAA